MANSSSLNIYPSDPTNYSAKITKYTLYYCTYIVLYDVTSEQKSKMSAYLPEYDRYIPLCESTGDTAKFIIFDPLDDNVAFPYNEWTELMENGVTSFIIHIICDEDTTLVYKLEKVDAINDANKTFMIEEDYFQVDYLGETNGEESDDSGGDNGEGSDSMAVYGIGENKCKVEVYPKTETYSKDEVYKKDEVYSIEEIEQMNDSIWNALGPLEENNSTIEERIAMLENQMADTRSTANSNASRLDMVERILASLTSGT